DDSTGVAQRFANLFGAVLVLHVHGAQILRQADVVGDEDDQSLRICPAKVVVDGGKLVFLLSAPVERLQIADEEHLKRRHQGWCLCEVKRFKDGCIGEVEVVQAEIAKIAGYESIQDAASCTLHQEGVVAKQNVTGAACIRGCFGEEAVDRCKAARAGGVGSAHRNDSIMSLTRASAKARAMRRTAAESSCTKPERSWVD